MCELIKEWISLGQLFLHLPGEGSHKNKAFWSSLVAQWVKDLILSLQQLRSLLWCGLDPWPRNFSVPKVQCHHHHHQRIGLLVTDGDAWLKPKWSFILEDNGQSNSIKLIVSDPPLFLQNNSFLQEEMTATAKEDKRKERRDVYRKPEPFKRPRLTHGAISIYLDLRRNKQKF